MKLLIEVNFESNNGLDMENKLNKAIDDFGDVLKKRGCTEMSLTGQEMVGDDIQTFYNITITE